MRTSAFSSAAAGCRAEMKKAAQRLPSSLTSPHIVLEVMALIAVVHRFFMLKMTQGALVVMRSIVRIRLKLLRLFLEKIDGVTLHALSFIGILDLLIRSMACGARNSLGDVPVGAEAAGVCRRRKKKSACSGGHLVVHV